MGTTVSVRILRACLLRAAVQLPGQVLEVHPLDAADLLAAGKAVLVDQADLALLYEARTGETMRLARESKAAGNIVGAFTPARR